ncbi:S-adenosyl-L-methionine-dependent methyltransferase [Flagelloscypha sp. PMI_526]|nr:S-adenosyl-L-methionine-dependent methyltransferase [Flagelloscypha sp. PMI_526]
MCRRIWNELTASFKKLPTSHRLPSQDDVACPQCVDDRRVERRVTRLKDEMGFHLEPEAFDIHVYDYIQYRSASGPASTGQVDNFHLSKGWISVQPMDRKKTGNQQDERELYFPGHASKWIELSEVIRKVHVLEYKQDCDNNDASARSAQQARYESRELWVNDSPLHFYVTVAISGPRLNFCKECVKKYRDQRRIESQVLDEFKAHPLRILDYCAGTGAFSLAIAEGSRCAKTDYAVEKGPSTAKTIKRNYPETTVINQDINDIFSQSSLKTRGKQSRILKQLCPIPNEVEIPPLPEVGKFDALVAGFPWSSPPHSHLNMFKRAHDPRNTLFLNVLSIIELHRFKYIFLENVPGFLSVTILLTIFLAVPVNYSQFSLGSRQDSPYRVTGGVQQGGLKIIYRVLLDLGYQVHCGLVQAGDLGLPQTRIRFFIVAALANLTLPDFPVPTHDFRDSPGSICRDLSFKLHVTGDDNRTIQARQHLRVSGTAPHPHISIRDSIYDLPRFDMKFSMPEKPQKVDWEIQHKLQDRKQISSLGAYPMTDTGCGPKASTSNYRSGPTTRFQMSCRLKPNGAKRAVGDLQHRTRRVNLEDARRIFLVPMGFVSDNQGDISTADYRAIPMEHRTWSLTNPLSWVARSGFRRGGFGRLNEQSCFQTIVTNVNVCAKQGQVLHPNQHRMVSIREVARAQGFPDDFYFVSENDNATVIFRQIGNAVPWPVGLAFGRELRKAVMKDWVAARSEEDFVMHDEFRRHFGPT